MQGRFRGACRVWLGVLAFQFAYLLSSAVFAAPTVLAGWDVHALAGGTNSFGASPLAATSADPNLIVGGLVRGSGVGTTGSAAARAWGGNNWTGASAAAAAVAGDHVSLTVSAMPGYVVSFTALSRLDYRRSGRGAAQGLLQYQIGNGAFKDAATLTYGSTAATGASHAPIDLSGIAELQSVPAGTVVTLRIVNYGGSSAGGTWYVFDTANSTAADLELSGTIASAVPVDGVCGAANGQLLSSAPTANLCSAGTPSAVGGSGPWTWTCVGSGGGGSASCAAQSASAGVCR